MGQTTFILRKNINLVQLQELEERSAQIKRLLEGKMPPPDDLSRAVIEQIANLAADNKIVHNEIRRLARDVGKLDAEFQEYKKFVLDEFSRMGESSGFCDGKQQEQINELKQEITTAKVVVNVLIGLLVATASGFIFLSNLYIENIAENVVKEYVKTHSK